MKTVNEISKIAGVSIRTLHYYDTIGLLKPAQVTKVGYRLYDNTCLNRLQIILMFRELQFPLKEIKKILDNPNFDWDEALTQQIQLLELQKIHITKLISLAHKIQMEGVNKMDFKEFNNTDFDQYAEEVKERWGDTLQYKEYKQKNQNNTDYKNKNIQNHLNSLFAEISTIKQLSVSDKIVQEKIKSLQKFITENYYNCSNEVLKGLGEMYINDERFKNNIDKIGGVGTAEFINKAILLYCK